MAADLAQCEGEGITECLQVSETGHEDYEFFYSGIEGFEHVPGTRYVIDVEVTSVDDPPADASSEEYRLIEIVEQDTSGDETGLADFEGAA